jgi:hypothetical protein
MSKKLDIEKKTRELSGEALPAEQQKKMISIESSTKLLDQIEGLIGSENFDTGRSQNIKGFLRKYIGPISWLGLGQSDAEQQFNTSTSALLNTYIQALSGAQTSPQEAERLQKEIPLLSDTRQEIANKIKVMRQKLSDQKDAINAVIGRDTTSEDSDPLGILGE